MGELKRLPDPGSALFTCGEPPKDGEYVWQGDKQYMVVGDLLVPVATADYKPSLGEKIAAKLMCPACLLPRFVPGHSFRGCQG